MKSKVLVFIQFFIITLMLVSINATPSYTIVGILTIILGITIGLTAIGHHQKNNFNIRPDIKEHCVLVTHGIYKYIRHPMYLSVLTMMGGVVILYPTIYHFFLYTILFITLITKLRYEESLWLCHTAQYQHYKKETKYLIPFIF
jgi:protein-S-isoprenylcysteine O-methyltransferase Ste14